ncbi:urea ABC transporter permease subunit UrtC [Nodularia sp. UHCC 0506]|uniref:urea ABC transporter permease subunit UrtC n=1 Tax=Nodularia sp. UHCC 0506 TaxID=3110243 RepID=UPI002B21D71B|nr:urea ABC transporter permease subunit UrtC [Nodularia sp. UHCC 0506]MEA5515981.1 urea ABC transporter permease subunit UrtC [Nodularia sp. UHCC 0506]
MKKKGGRLILIEVGVVVAIALILILIMPAMLSAFRLNLLGRFLSLAIVALGLDLIWGYTGLLSLGHGIFFSLGGYAIAMYLKLQVPSGELPDFMGLYGVTELPWFWQPFYSFPVATVAVVLIPGLLAGLLGYLVFRNRLKGVYFSILTQAAVIIFFNFFNGQQKLFNGTNGLTGFRTLFEANVSDSQTQFIFYTLTVIFLAATYGICRWLTSGRFGRLLIAIRDDESRVRFSGYNPTEFKVLVFAVSGAIAGIAGAFYTLQSGSVSPRSMDIAFSIEMVIWVAVGGRATLTGAIVGTLLVNYARTFLSEQFAEIWLFFQGVLFLIVVTVLPDGIMGWLKNQKMTLFNRPQQIATYPTLEEDPEVQNERQNLGN